MAVGWGSGVPAKADLQRAANRERRIDELQAELNRVYLERDLAQQQVDRYVALYGPLPPPVVGDG